MLQVIYCFQADLQAFCDFNNLDINKQIQDETIPHIGHGDKELLIDLFPQNIVFLTEQESGFVMTLFCGGL